MTGRDEARDIVDMAIGMIVQQAVTQPDHIIDAEGLCEGRFGIGLGPVAIAVRIEQALPCRQQPPFPVNINRAAFQHDIMGAHADALDTGDGSGGLRIARHQVFAAPAIEAEGLSLRAALPFGDDRPGIAQPDIAGRHLDDLSHVAHRRPRRLRRLVGACRQFDRHEGRCGTNKGGNIAAGPVEIAAPLVGKPGPAAPEGGLRRPFGREETGSVSHRRRALPQVSNKEKGGPHREPPFPNLHSGSRTI